MDYQKIYESLIEKAKNRIIEVGSYYELHHIIPKCIGGNNDENNKVKLTYREHFVAHWLLSNIYKDNRSLLVAFKFMAYGNGFTQHNKIIPGSKFLEEKRINLNKRSSSDEHKKKVIEGRLKKKLKREAKLNKKLDAEKLLNEKLYNEKLLNEKLLNEELLNEKLGDEPNNEYHLELLEVKAPIYKYFNGVETVVYAYSIKEKKSIRIDKEFNRVKYLF